MKRRFPRSTRFYTTAATLVLIAGLVAWAAWGSPSVTTLAWTAVVAVGLLAAITMAIRDGAATRSVAHLLHDVEHPLPDVPAGTARKAAQ